MAYSGSIMNKSLFRLVAGFKKFREKYFLQEDLESSIYQRLSTSPQAPKTLLIGCSDSRVDPAIMTGASPGEIFVVRNVANLVPPCEHAATGFHGTSSALEFAVVNLKVENIIVLGHRQCGGIHALMKGPQNESHSFVGQWMSIAAEARKNVIEAHPKADEATWWRLMEMESLKISYKNLHSFPFVKEAIQNRQLTVLAIYFDLEQGQLWELNQATQEFRQLDI
jgi:carbonic anhydrase